MERRYGVKPQPLSPMLSESGSLFEREMVASLATRSPVTNLQNQDAREFIEALNRQPGGRMLYYQVRLEGKIGQIKCEGIADLIEIARDAHGRLDAVVIDIKASRR